ncbi:hypothetical protein [Paludibaculum fermentans]|uniref:hypothetical protein n=1 Tax=Paludibaculum fermentans TaxID=1473598 RepID=UPI003EB706BA
MTKRTRSYGRAAHVASRHSHYHLPAGIATRLYRQALEQTADIADPRFRALFVQRLLLRGHERRLFQLEAKLWAEALRVNHAVTHGPAGRQSEGSRAPRPSPGVTATGHQRVFNGVPMALRAAKREEIATNHDRQGVVPTALRTAHGSKRAPGQCRVCNGAVHQASLWIRDNHAEVIQTLGRYHSWICARITVVQKALRPYLAQQRARQAATIPAVFAAAAGSSRPITLAARNEASGPLSVQHASPASSNRKPPCTGRPPHFSPNSPIKLYSVTRSETLYLVSIQHGPP